MNIWLFFFATLFIALSTTQCASNTYKTDSTQILQSNSDSIFTRIKSFPLIEDSSLFIADLCKTFHLEECNDPTLYSTGRITNYQKVKIYGSPNEFIFIEYEYDGEVMVTYPWKYQFVLTLDGKLIEMMSALRYEFIQILPNEKPYLLTLTSTSKGNGAHQLWKFNSGKFEDMLIGSNNLSLRTYDAHEDNTVNEPYELNIEMKDYNADGYVDIAFVGKIVFVQAQSPSGEWYDGEVIKGRQVDYSLENPFKKTPLEIIFLYDPKSGIFKFSETNSTKVDLE